jgi:hypothetical protein
MITVKTYFKRENFNNYKITKVLFFGFLPLFIKKVEVK